MDLTTELATWGPGAKHAPPSLDAAQAYCRQLARSHYENFTVASRLFPRHLEQHLCNVYAYCRWADDLADETADRARSLELLDWWEGQLDRLYGREHPHPGPLPEGEGAGIPRHPVFVALAQTVNEFDLPRQPLAELLAAFRRDQVQLRYETFDELLAYCTCSANPVGRIVLYLGRLMNHAGRGSPDPALFRLSDSICTGLQLTNFCQDVRRDYERGRIYLPLADCRHHGWDEARFADGQCDEAFRDLLAEQVSRAEQFLREGEPLVGLVGKDLRLPVRLFIDGGLAILAAIRRGRYDVWSQRPEVGRWTKLRLAARAWWQAGRATGG